jgi:N-acetylglucosaminyldiphosphoundecaprenol N-acetyl-beta-D-mannosaminyltransferase
MSSEPLPSVRLLGCRVHRVTMRQALDAAQGFLQDGRPHMIVTADASMLTMAAEDEDLRDLINGADLVVPDSTGVVWAAQRAGSPVPERVPGVDLMEALCEMGGRLGRTAYFLGAAPGVAEEAARKLEEKFPGFRVVGTHHGFLQSGDAEKIEREIQGLKPDFLFVAMGIPRQEKWIRARMETLRVPVSMGVGGSFDCHSGRVRRAPRIFQRLSIEWLHRLLMNPKKYQKVALLPGFVVKILRQNRDR